MRTDDSERVRYDPDGSEAEWSRRSNASLEPNEHIRMSLRAENGGHIQIADLRMTSDKPTAQEMHDTGNSLVNLTQDEARWLLRVLPDAIHFAAGNVNVNEDES